MVKLSEVEKAVLSCEKNNGNKCEECVYSNCNIEDFNIMLEIAKEKKQEIKKEKEYLINAKKYFVIKGYDVVWSKSYKQYLLIKGSEEIWHTKASLILKYLKDKEIGA